jgi:hypothetical protein
VGFQVFPDFPYDGTLFAGGEDLPAVLGVPFEETSNDGEQKRLAMQGPRMSRYCPMEALQLSEELVVRYDGTIQIWQVISIRDVKRQLPQGFRTEAQRTVEVSIRRCRSPVCASSPLTKNTRPGGVVCLAPR